MASAEANIDGLLHKLNDIAYALQDAYLKPRLTAAEYSEVCLCSLRELGNFKSGLLQAASDMSILSTKLQRTQDKNDILRKRADAAERCVASADTLVMLRTTELEAATKRMKQLEVINASLMRRINADKDKSRSKAVCKDLSPLHPKAPSQTGDLSAQPININTVKDQEEEPSIAQPPTPLATAPLVAQPTADAITATHKETSATDTNNTHSTGGFFDSMAGFLGWGANKEETEEEAASLNRCVSSMAACDDLYACSSDFDNTWSSEGINLSRWIFW